VKRIGILTGGGDVAPLNAVIAAAKDAAARAQVELIGFIKGWQGLIDKNYTCLSDIMIDPYIGGSILQSSRVNLQQVPDGVQIVKDHLKDLYLEGLIVVGGEDTLSNSFYLKDFPQALISKTIDNDVGMVSTGRKGFGAEDITNYFTLGYPTAAQKISAFVSLSEGLRTTAYSHERLMVVESMGMHAGWLALSSGMGHPDFIVIPEYPLDYDLFRGVVSERYKALRHLIIVVAEGARWKDGSSLSADESEKDGFGHPRFKGAAEVLAKRLKNDLKDEFDTRNVNAVNPSYLYRSGCPGELDLEWAQNLGREAVKMLIHSTDEPNGKHGRSEAIFLTIQRQGKVFSILPYSLNNVAGIDALHRFVDDRFYDSDRYAITENGKKYLAAIMDELPNHHGYGIWR
jgi:6-phosphofructokinase 1